MIVFQSSICLCDLPRTLIPDDPKWISSFCAFLKTCMQTTAAVTSQATLTSTLYIGLQ